MLRLILNFNYINTAKFSGIWLTLPIVITSFGYQIIIPSLRPYLNSDTKQLRKAILIGSILPLIVYLIWEFLIMGVIPAQGQNSLMSILAGGQPAVGLTSALQNLLHHPWIARIEKYFAFFAITTSFIGVSFSLFDFLADGFHIKKNQVRPYLDCGTYFYSTTDFHFSLSSGLYRCLRVCRYFRCYTTLHPTRCYGCIRPLLEKNCHRLSH